MRCVCAIKVIILNVMAAATPRHSIASANNELLSTRNLMNEIIYVQLCMRGVSPRLKFRAFSNKRGHSFHS
jgi:hypothetical protein